MSVPGTIRLDARRSLFWLVFALVLAVPRLSAAHGTLGFFKNYFVTGDYAVAGVALRGTGVGGFATGTVHVEGVPATADILAAFLYWQTVQAPPFRGGSAGARFRDHDISQIARALNPSGVPPCWSMGGSNKMLSYRADVLRFLDQDPVTGKLRVNGDHAVRLPDSGGAATPSTGGATLLVVYRDSDDPLMPLRSIVLYDGGQTVVPGRKSMSQALTGFYQASATEPRARLTAILGEGLDRFTETLTVNSGAVFVDPVGPVWDNPTLVLPAGALANASKTTLSVTSSGNTLDCLSWSATVFSTVVQDTDRDGLLDVWETSSSLVDPRGRALPNLKAMGASPTVQDIFVEVGYMTTAGYDNPVQGAVGAHSHLPSKKALDAVATAFRNAAPRPTIAGPINIHFDIGSNYQPPTVNPATGQPYPALPSASQCQNAWTPSCAIIPASVARGGEALDEIACIPKPGRTCVFPDYPGTVGWKSAYKFFRDQPLTHDTEGECVAAGAACVRRFDAVRKDMFHYALFAHALGIRRSDVDDPQTPFDETSTPKNTSGIADPPGGDLLVTLGFWDDWVGTDFMQASTFLHELGHNLRLRHGGPPQIFADGSMLPLPNCRPNYQSIMNYLFQVRGLLTANGSPTVDFSRQMIGALDEQGLQEASGMGALAYRARWYGPWNNSFIDAGLGTTPSDRRCNGTRLGPGEPAMARLDSPSLPTALNPAIDWDGDGTLDGTPAQDVNYSGGALTTLPGGSDDFLTMDLRQIGGRRNVGSRRLEGAMSLDMGFGDVGFGDVGFGDVGFGDVGFGDVGFGDVGFGDVGFGDVGFGDVGFGDVGFGDVGVELDENGNPISGSAAGEVDLETAAALGNAPNNLVTSVPGSSGIRLSWAPPHVGAVLTYEVYRVTGATVTPQNFLQRVAIQSPTTATTVVDSTTQSKVTYTYFVIANLEDGSRTSVSNFATVTR
jgi:hypothetical protein